MFSLKKQLAKLCIISGFELMISCIPRGCADHCTTSVDADTCLCMVLVCLLGERNLAAGVGHPARGPQRHPRRPWRHLHGPSGSLGFPGPGLRSQGTQAPAAGHWTWSWSCHCGHQCWRASSESDCRHTPFKTRFDAIAKQNKNYVRACGPVPQLLKTFAKFEEVNQRMVLSGHLLSLER